MCGIAGFRIADGDLGLINTEAMTWSLGIDMMKRGSDATGIFTVDRKGRFKLRKKAVQANVFLAGREGIGRSAQTLLLHTRAATQGRPENNLNNHPIEYNNIVGIHNGIVYNDDDLFSHFKWERKAAVDSEAIFAALAHLPLREALENIEAGWAIAWVDTAVDSKRLWLARGETSPLEYMTTTNGSVIFASTASAVKEAATWGGIKDVEYKHITTAPQGFLAYCDGNGLTVMEPFDGSGKNSVAKRTRYTHASMAQTQGYGHAWGGYSNWDDDDNPYAKTGGGYLAATNPGQRRPKDASTTNARPYERVTVSGDPKSPKVGDRRKFFDSDGIVHVEICTSASPNVTGWKEVVDTNGPKAPPVKTEVVGSQLVRTETLPNGTRLVSSRPVSTTGTDGSDKTVSIEADGDGVAQIIVTKQEEPATEAVVLPFHSPDCKTAAQWADFDRLVEDSADSLSGDNRHGIASVGDVIYVPNRLLGGIQTFGGIIGRIVKYHVETERFEVEWLQGTIDSHAEYEVVIKAQKGAMNASNPA